MKTPTCSAALLALTLLVPAAAVRGGEIGFVEDFSFAEDRAVPLKQLIPGTEDYYYYHCLRAQQTGDAAKVRELLAEWIKRHNVTDRVREIQDRQALLDYGAEPRKALDYIRDRLGLRFDHQKLQADRKTDLPSTLDPALISRQALTDKAFAKFRNLNGLEDRALEFLVGMNLDPDRRRNLLERLVRPDYSNLVDLVLADLRHPNSGGFGCFRIHGALLLEQLDACLKQMPELLNNGNFVNAYLARLRPGEDVDWPNDPKEKEAYLDRLWAFVARLPPAQNSLKAHVLYQRLAFDRERGGYD